MPAETREGWLVDAVGLLRPAIEEHTDPLAPLRVSVGWPRGGRGAIGQCWFSESSADDTHELFISPVLSEPGRVLDVLAHELIHVGVGSEAGHKAPFRRVAHAIGLEGKMTATVAGELFTQFAVPLLSELGPYPHGALDPAATGGRRKQTTRMLKMECPACGFVARATAKWLSEVGPPTCACGEQWEIV